MDVIGSRYIRTGTDYIGTPLITDTYISVGAYHVNGVCTSCANYSMDSLDDTVLSTVILMY